MEIILETPRLVFRRFAPGDAAFLVELDSDPEVMRWINGGVPTPRERIEREVVPAWLALSRERSDHGFFIACERAGGEPVGWFHLKPGYYWPTEIDVGYRLLRRFWGQGLATEGTRAFIAHAFDVQGEPRVIATTMAGNAASRRVLEKSGMAIECEFQERRWPGEDKRAVKYAIERRHGASEGKAD